MRGWRIEATGAPAEVMRWGDLPRPTPGPGELLVAVEAAGVSFPDLLLVRGEYQTPLDLPATPGNEVVGRVVEAGAGTSTPPGTRGVALAGGRHGGFAELAVVHESRFGPLADGCDACQAVALPVNFVTAHLALHHRARVQPGEIVLVHGGAGGVGSATIQLGVAAGARVMATVIGAERVAFCHRLGAERAVDVEREDVVAAVAEATGGHGADIIVDTVGAEMFDLSRRMVAWEGRIIVVGFTGGRIPELKVNQLILRHFSVMGVSNGGTLERRPDVHRASWASVVERGDLAPHVHAVYPLEAAIDAYRDLAAGKVLGKAVIEMAASV